VLEACYIVARVRETRELRDHIRAISGESGFLGVEYPRDGLTGALDRRALPEVLKRESTWVDRYGIPLSFVLLDIHDFSKLNENQGNMAGDLVLKDLAQAVQTTMRQTDSVLRYGADEFLCLLPRTDAGGGAAFIRRVRQACQRSARLRQLVFDTGLAVYTAGNNVNVILANVENDLAARKSP
jgi:diguanylate cyclase (GGDEF)-like protein